MRFRLSRECSWRRVARDLRAAHSERPAGAGRSGSSSWSAPQRRALPVMDRDPGARRACRRIQCRWALGAMSACCSLDELGEPSFAEHRFRLLPARSPGPAPGARQPPGSQQCRQAPARPDTTDPAVPGSSSGGGCLPAHGAPWGSEGSSPSRRASLPCHGAGTGGSWPWFPMLRLAFHKWLSSCEDFSWAQVGSNHRLLACKQGVRKRCADAW